MWHFLVHSIGRSPARLHALLAATVIALLAAELFGMHALHTSEARLVDVFMRRHAAEYRADPAIVVVDIDDRSMAAMQEVAGLWSWPREIHADLLEALAEFAPRAIVFDIIFSERDLKRPKSDARLSKAIKRSQHVYLPAARLDSSLDASGTAVRELSGAFGMSADARKETIVALQLPHAIDRDAWRMGLMNSIEDGDGVLRRYRLHHDLDGWRLPSLPARVVNDLGSALPSGADFLMRWPQTGHKRYSYGDLYRLLTEQRPALNADEVRTLDALFRGRIILIGASATGSFDHHLTPLGAGYPGVDVLAVALDNLKNGRSVQVAPALAPFLFGAASIVLLALAFAWRIHPVAIGAALAGESLIALAAADIAIGRDLLLPTATPLVFAWTFFLCAAIAGYLRERRTREQAVALFRRFLNPVVVRRIVDQGETVESLSGRTCNVSVLFSDIRGFTTLSETRPPPEVVALLNRYFERQVEVVFRHGGTLDKFIGDCIMAFWGAPLDDPDHAHHAVAAALEMQETLLAFKQELAAEGSDVAAFDAGIGIHSGPAVVGFIGARRKLDYTAIGDTVNLASRVEGLTRDVARVLVTRETVLACRDSGSFSFEPRGAFSVKGRSATVDLFEPRRKIT